MDSVVYTMYTYALQIITYSLGGSQQHMKKAPIRMPLYLLEYICTGLKCLNLDNLPE